MTRDDLRWPPSAELAQLYEKIKLQQCTLQQGERQYAERVHALSALQKDIALLRSELVTLKVAISPPPDLNGQGCAYGSIAVLAGSSLVTRLVAYRGFPIAKRSAARAHQGARPL